jgi:ribosomal protein L11 methyltransferase
MNYLEIVLDVSCLSLDMQDIMIAKMNDSGFDSFEQKANVIHAFTLNTKLSIDELLELGNDLPFSFNVTDFKILEDKNWNHVWESNFNPVLINNCYIRAPFHDIVENIKYDILISPNMSFGTGHHETTNLMISNLLQINCVNKNVLDIGSGTGVLSILSEKKGASKISSLDIDTYAYRNTLDNVKLNNCHNISTYNSDVYSLSSDQKFDILLANINKNIIISQLSQYISLMSKDAVIVLSGFFDSDFEIIHLLALKYKLKLKHDVTKNKWKCAVYLK